MIQINLEKQNILSNKMNTKNTPSFPVENLRKYNIYNNKFVNNTIQYSKKSDNFIFNRFEYICLQMRLRLYTGNLYKEINVVKVPLEIKVES